MIKLHVIPEGIEEEVICTNNMLMAEDDQDLLQEIMELIEDLHPMVHRHHEEDQIRFIMMK